MERASDFLRVAVLRNALCAAVCLTKTDVHKLSEAVDGRALGMAAYRGDPDGVGLGPVGRAARR